MEDREVNKDKKPAPKDREKGIRNEKTFENVMFITHTRDSKLKKEIQRMEDALGWKDRMKYVEKSGINLSQTLVQKGIAEEKTA